MILIPYLTFISASMILMFIHEPSCCSSATDDMPVSLICTQQRVASCQEFGHGAAGETQLTLGAFKMQCVSSRKKITSPSVLQPTLFSRFSRFVLDGLELMHNSALVKYTKPSQGAVLNWLCTYLNMDARPCIFWLIFFSQ